MQTRDYSPTKKALQINLDDAIYGTFAEIGAGQEVARHFFQAGRASHTVAKTISAYDMTFSDEIYGKEARYVCESRVKKMLDYEFSLIEERLSQQRGATSQFFSFADTVASANQDAGDGKSHGWLGIRFQTKPGGRPNDIILHIKLWDRFRLQQQEALGIIGVNLIHMAFFPPDTIRERISMLIESLSAKRVEINLIRANGPDLVHLDNRLLNLELVKQGLTEAVLFGPKSEILHAADDLYGKPVLVQRGTFRPITSSNLEIVEKVRAQFAKHSLANGVSPKVLFEITINSLTHQSGHLDDDDFLNRVDTLAALGQEVLLSNFSLFYQMKSYLRQNTAQGIGVVIGASLLEKMFEAEFYKVLPGGILEGMSRLFDEKTKVFVFPHKDGKTCLTAKTFSTRPELQNLYQHFLQNDWITDVLDCDNIDTGFHSADVRKMLESGDPQWKKLVPDQVRQLIEDRQLFGYRPK